MWQTVNQSVMLPSDRVLMPLMCCLSCAEFRVDRDDMNRVVHSNDAFAPVAYLNLCKMHLEEKSAQQRVMSDAASKCEQFV